MSRCCISFALAFPLLCIGCQPRVAIVLRVYDEAAGKPVARAEVARWHNKSLGLGALFSMRRVVEDIRMTDAQGEVRVEGVGKYDHLDVIKHGYEKATVYSFTRRPHLFSMPISGNLARDPDGAYLVPLHAAVPPGFYRPLTAAQGQRASATGPAPPRD